MDSGFNPDGEAKKYEYSDTYEIVVFPDKTVVEYPNESLPLKVQESVKAIIEAEDATTKAEKASVAGTWDGEI